MEVHEKFALHQRFLMFYKKDTLALFFSFFFTFMLASALLVLMHTNHRTENTEYKTIFTPSDCLIRQLSPGQADRLRNHPDIRHLALEAEDGSGDYTVNDRQVYMHRGDDAFITLMATVIQGTLPRTDREIAAEKWVLLNLGVNPSPGAEFHIRDGEGRTKKVKVSAILSDMRGNVQYGVLSLYAGLKKDGHRTYTAYLTLRDKADDGVVPAQIQKETGIRTKQIRKSPAREDFQELYRMDLQWMGVLLAVCLVIFYGIYKIVLMRRVRQYGILRALGMKRGQLLGMILLELYRIYLPGAPAGIAAGILAALVIGKISGDVGTVVYLYNEPVTYELVLPVAQIAICVLVMAVLTGLAGCMTGWEMIRRPVAEIISGAAGNRRSRLHIPGITIKAGKFRTLFCMSGNYLVRNIRMSIFVMITICTGITLFTALAYQTRILRTYREDTKELWYLNGQYEMSVRSFHSAYHGVPAQNVHRIQKMEGVSGIKISAGMPVRVVDTGGVWRNDAYYDRINAGMKENNGYELRGHDGTDQIYKTNISGYNEAALKELKKYVVSGSFDPNKIQPDEIILAVPSLYDGGGDGIAGWYKEGVRLMDYHAGDEITMKYRRDFKTDTMAYETLTDTGEYIYRTYRIAAIVSFDYMFNCNRYEVYPRMITDWENIRDLAPDVCCQCVYIDAEADLSPEAEQQLEQELIRTGAESGDVSTRSLAGSREQNRMFYYKQMVCIYGIAITAFVLLLINMANNIACRMHVRTGEICMLRAVGLSVAMARQLFLYENMTAAVVSVIVAYAVSHPVTRTLYNLSDMKVYGHDFVFDVPAFALISTAAVLLCAALSVNVIKSWKTRQLAQVLGKTQ